jgi:type IV fimbrial biogenesis protein FimT
MIPRVCLLLGRGPRARAGFRPVSIPPSPEGFTLIELIVVVAVLSIVLGLGVPAMQSILQRGRLKEVAELLAADLRFARAETTKRKTAVSVSYSPDAWCYGISEAGGCDCTSTNCVLSVAGAGVEKKRDGSDFPAVAMSGNTFPGTPPRTRFDAVRGTASAGSVTFATPTGADLRVVVSATGRVRICSPSDTVAGYGPC